MIVFLKIFNEKWSLLNLDEQQDCSGLDIKRQICKTKGIRSTDIYFTCNGSILENNSKIKSDSFVHCHVRVPGGKGGFGSMLRAIGAQIEKTTNREACRDLSGRRMRDVNDEKKIADWLSKKEERDAEKARRKQERLERLQTTPKHVFEDSTSYTSQLQENMDNIDDALQKGLKSTSSSSTSSSLGKRKSSEKKKSHSKKRRLWLDIDEDLSSDSEEDSDTRSSCSSVADSDFSENSSKASSIASAKSNLMPKNTSKTTSSEGNPSLGSKSDDFEETIGNDSCETLNTSTAKQKNHSNDKEYEQVYEGEQQQTTGMKDNASSPYSNIETSKNQESKLQHTTAKSEDVISMSNSASSKPSSDTGEEKKKPTENDEISTGKSEQIVKITSSSVNVPLDLDQFNSIAELESLGLDVLKSALMSLGLKCGGTLQQRAERLFSVKGIPHDKIEPSLFAKTGKKSKEKKR